MYLTENLLFAAVLVAALLPLIARLTSGGRRRVHLLGLVFLAFVVLAATAKRSPRDVELAQALPAPNLQAGMRSSGTCLGCHPGEYAAWYASFHRTMTQVAGPDTVVAPFDGRKLEGRGRAFVVDRRGEEFWITEVEPGRRSREVEVRAPERVVMTTGSRHQQIYWTASPRGGLTQVPWVYEIASGSWIPSEDSFLRPADWQQSTPTWNQECIRCHTSGPLPNFDFESGQWETQVTELGIACASCHGPASEHLRANRSPLRRHLFRALNRPDPTIVNAERLSKERSAQVCGQCHSFALFHDGFHSDSWTTFRPGKAMDDHFRLFMGAEHQDAFWPDGTSRIGGREYNGMILSGCYTQGEMTCLSCHEMHADEPRDQLAAAMDADEACLQCHANFRDRIEEHTFHKAASTGSRCYNCHMPYTSYALLGAARAHRVDSPTVSGQGTTDRPNACNLCHLDKTLGWTADYLGRWYDAPSVHLDDEHQQVAASVLWSLRGDAGQRSIAAWHMGQLWAREASGDGWMTPYLARLLQDPYSAVRLIAYRSLLQIGGETTPAFDHLGDAAERTRASRAVLRQWAESAAPAVSPATLIGEFGVIRQEQFEQIYAERDNRRLILTE